MLTRTEITGQDLERLLSKLAPDRDAAAAEYERIRAGLVRYYSYRGCDEPEALADETINRVAVKLAVVDFDGNAKFSTYFYAFASRIHLEYLRADKRSRERAEAIAAAYGRADDGSDAEAVAERHSCLERCLAALPADARRLLMEYYGSDSSKADHRRALAGNFGITIEALHTRVSRHRTTVGKCVRQCLSDG